jgi:putative FmdB family regulatory protein
MPTYEYVCEACGHVFDEFQSITAKPLKKCPACAKPKLRRKIGTGAGIIFKGSGFYETDYRSEGYKQAAKAESDAAKPAEARSEAKTESKSDSNQKAKTESKTESKPAATKTDSKPTSKPTTPAKA